MIQWTGESHPTREDTLAGLSGADAVFCCRVDKIDAEFLDAAGSYFRSGSCVCEYMVNENL